ncbi:MAG: phage tail sheath subtilisin-like domain-containing protein [Lentisphaeraceae bacterium]|nr:phage tail sheath subtilisin-like domain-containing protein [Lentisphaeraceae bacterium]
MTYKTPDVYVKEISVFPPSVAEVATAIPAFIGYTQEIVHKGTNNKHKAVEIKSLVDFEEIFGGGPKLDVTTIKVDGLNNVTEMDINTNYYLYDSLKLYFTNGGGKCYIISCGQYNLDGSVSDADFTACLSALAKEDEPTIILFPDAISLASDKFYQLQKDALAQSGKLMDRVVVMDMLTEDGKAKVDEFREKVGMQNLKYGAAYTPYLKASFTKTVKLKDFYNKLSKSGSPLKLSELTTDTEVLENIALIEQLYKESAKIESLLSDTVKSDFEANLIAAKTSPTAGKVKTLIKDLYEPLGALQELALVDSTTVEASYTLTTKNNLKTYTKDLINKIKADVELFNQYNIEGGSEIASPDSSFFADPSFTFDDTIWGASVGAPDMTGVNNIDESSDPKRLEKLRDLAAGLAQTIINAYQQVEAAAKELESSLESFIFETVTTVKNIATKIANSVTVMPPSGAIAGIYADTDAKRGVWKAPANVSLSGVIGVTEKIDSEDQEDLNVDPVAGKSVNAIREFSGKGVLVWGARTLAGNDNEWRYVPVRRFFNMVEESIKKSTYWAVFEPNDANLWVKLKSMIENYLIQKWREGALAGAKPEQAFYVNVGLGKTMTAQDILEGRLVIDIGMAAVRPAEFIVLRFMHKMQES